MAGERERKRGVGRRNLKDLLSGEERLGAGGGGALKQATLNTRRDGTPEALSYIRVMVSLTTT